MSDMQRLTLGDTGDFINGMGFKKDDWHEQGTPIIRIQNLTDPSKPINTTRREVPEKYHVNNGDILVSWSATLDAFIWNRGPAYLNQHIFKVVPNHTLVNPKFLFYLLKFEIGELSKSAHAHGSTMKHINRGPFLAHPVSIPERPEQLAIVDEIETQFARLDDAESALRRAEMRLGVLRSSISTAVVAEAEADSLSIPSTVGALAVDVRYGTSQKTGPEGEIPVLRMGNIYQGRLRFENLKFVTRSQLDSATLMLLPGDLLFNRTNSAELVGKSAVFEGSPNKYSFASYLIRVRFSDPSIAKYVAILINSPRGREWITSVVSQQVGQANVNGTKLKALGFQLPAIDLLTRIVTQAEQQFSMIDRLEHDVVTSRLHITQLRQSILRKAFGGTYGQ